MQYLSEALQESGFQNVIWTDESSIQIETHKRHCYRLQGCPPKRKPKQVISLLICMHIAMPA